ncbi:Trans-2-enoyl-CoA reductase, mitochondrial [Smittium mucronatum]|uniref:Trans-2-enoyl-CoA reductase, mitochondrial n=1 Tax=Smittium mucronatum TaxID=133383 RepID=A0A1R0GXT9_9FUNG|nr:Trans-2-enoyl-CoA reductase, mitochondrial [Smittium mucronatum]
MSWKNYLSSRAAVLNGKGLEEDNIEIIDIDLPPLSENQILVEMVLSSISPYDFLRSRGLYIVPSSHSNLDQNSNSHTHNMDKINGYVAGVEGIGKIVKVGANALTLANGSLELGDYVIPLNFSSYGSWSSLVILNPEYVIPLKGVNFDELKGLVSVGINAMTAYRLLKDIVSISENEYIIQNGLDGEIGQYIVQLAKLKGYRTINVLNDDSDFENLAATLYDFGADVILKESDLKSGSHQEFFDSLNSPIRLALNCVGGISAKLLADHLSYGGTLVTYGDQRGEPISLTSFQYTKKNIRMISYLPTDYFSSHKPEDWISEYSMLLRMLRNGELKPINREFIKMYINENGGDNILECQEFKERLLDAIKIGENAALQFSST